ncbi:MAG: hypothetical protein KAG14_03620, partial [Mycoplasmataceae bacterium]|nr:hypothetical protein [Mycoplasmataceae bacterium]
NRTNDYSKDYFNYKLNESIGDVKEMIKILEEQSLNFIDSAEIVYNKYYRAVKFTKSIFTYLIPSKKEEKVRIFTNNKIMIKEWKSFKEHKTNHWGVGDYSCEIKSTSEMNEFVKILLKLQF